LYTALLVGMEWDGYSDLSCDIFILIFYLKLPYQFVYSIVGRAWNGLVLRSLFSQFQSTYLF